MVSWLSNVDLPITCVIVRFYFLFLVTCRQNQNMIIFRLCFRWEKQPRNALNFIQNNNYYYQNEISLDIGL